MKKIIKLKSGRKIFYIRSVGEKQIEVTQKIILAKNYYNTDSFSKDLDHVRFYYGEGCVSVVKLDFMNIYTDERISVSARIKKGLTFASVDLKVANRFAESIGSYTYDLFENVKGRLIFWGHGVPK